MMMHIFFKIITYTTYVHFFNKKEGKNKKKKWWQNGRDIEMGRINNIKS